jgi:DNA-damage-inducible protein D
MFPPLTRGANARNPAMKHLPTQFENHAIRRVYDEDAETWGFSVVDIIQVLTQQEDFQVARNYWKVLKNRLAKEGNESVTKCNRLKLPESVRGKKPK